MTEREGALTGAEELVQRFIDQELSGDERVQFLVRLGRDQALRERAIDLERLGIGVSRLPRPIVPEGFVARVMARVPPPPPTRRRFVAGLWAPRALQWNLGGAMAAAALALLVTGLLVSRGRTDRPAPASPAAATRVSAAAPVLVRLVVLQPEATTVEVAGDFNGWDPTRHPLEPAASGAWMITIPLEPGRYEYMFVVDGQRWIADPFAVEQNDDGFGSRNAVLDVRPPMEAAL